MKHLCLSLLLFSAASVSPALANTNETSSYFDSLFGAATQAVTQTVLEVVGSTFDGNSQSDVDVVASDPADPFEKYNRLMFRFNRALDEKALQPIASNYRQYTPGLCRPC